MSIDFLLRNTAFSYIIKKRNFSIKLKYKKKKKNYYYYLVSRRKYNILFSKKLHLDNLLISSVSKYGENLSNNLYFFSVLTGLSHTNYDVRNVILNKRPFDNYFESHQVLNAESSIINKKQINTSLVFDYKKQHPSLFMDISVLYNLCNIFDVDHLKIGKKISFVSYYYNNIDFFYLKNKILNKIHYKFNYFNKLFSYLLASRKRHIHNKYNIFFSSFIKLKNSNFITLKKLNKKKKLISYIVLNYFKFNYITTAFLINKFKNSYFLFFKKNVNIFFKFCLQKASSNFFFNVLFANLLSSFYYFFYFKNIYSIYSKFLVKKTYLQTNFFKFFQFTFKTKKKNKKVFVINKYKNKFIRKKLFFYYGLSCRKDNFNSRKFKNNVKSNKKNLKKTNKFFRSKRRKLNSYKLKLKNQLKIEKHNKYFKSYNKKNNLQKLEYNNKKKKFKKIKLSKKKLSVKKIKIFFDNICINANNVSKKISSYFNFLNIKTVDRNSFLLPKHYFLGTMYNFLSWYYYYTMYAANFKFKYLCSFNLDNSSKFFNYSWYLKNKVNTKNKYFLLNLKLKNKYLFFFMYEYLFFNNIYNKNSILSNLFLNNNVFFFNNYSFFIVDVLNFFETLLNDTDNSVYFNLSTVSKDYKRKYFFCNILNINYYNFFNVHTNFIYKVLNDYPYNFINSLNVNYNIKLLSNLNYYGNVTFFSKIKSSIYIKNFKYYLYFFNVISYYFKNINYFKLIFISILNDLKNNLVNLKINLKFFIIYTEFNFIILNYYLILLNFILIFFKYKKIY